MTAVFKKDFASLFHGFIGWLFLAVMWGILSLYIGMSSFIGLDPDITAVLAVSSVIMIVMLPILSMRSFAEERKTRTDQMILTAPVSIGQVVLGKYLALAAVHSIVVLGLCLYPLLLSCFGTVPFAQSYTGLFGMWLFGLAELAVCVFLSSLTENVIIAAVLSFACLFLSMIMPNLEQMISADGNLLTTVLGALDIPSRFDSFLNGKIDLTALVYLASVVFLFLFLTTQVLQKRRYTVSRNTLSFGAYSTGLVALVLAVTIAANLAVNQLPSSYTVHDVTESGLYSLTDDTKEYLKQLDQDVTIYVLASTSDKDSALDSTLQQMAEESAHLKIQYVDPAANPSFLQKYDDVMDCTWNSLIVESGSRHKTLNYSDLYEYSIDYSTYQQSVTGYDAEGQVDSAIAYVVSEKLPKVYLLTGHGEESLGSNFTSVLTKLNCEYEDLDLLKNDTVPEDCGLLIINGPATDLSADDADKVLDYLQNGGKLIATTNFQEAEDMTNWDRVLAYYGVSASKGVVLENNPGYYYRLESYLLPEVSSTDETSSVVSGNGYVFMAYSQAFTEEEAGAEITKLLTTSDNAYIHSGVTSETENFEKKDTDVTGQYTLGMKAVVNAEKEASEESEEMEEEEESDAAEESEGAEESTAYLFGSVLTFSDGADQMVSGSNSTLFSNVVRACMEDEDGAEAISVPVKSISQESLTVPSMTAIVLNLVCIVLIPLALLITGFVIWLVRRRA